MKILMQTVDECRVLKGDTGEFVSQISNGHVFYVGFDVNDMHIPADELVTKAEQWIISNNKNKAMMLLSQFTLLAHFKKTKPSFHHAAPADKAFILFGKLFERLKNQPFRVEKGIFQTFLYIQCISTNLCSIVVDL